MLCARFALESASPFICGALYPGRAPGTEFPTMSSCLPNTLAVAKRSPHLFSISGDTALDGPLGQNFSWRSFSGAISRSWRFRSDALEIFNSPLDTRVSQSCGRGVGGGEEL